MLELKIPDLPWWRTDPYTVNAALTPGILEHAGPNGVALVRAYEDGRTDPGWGLTSPKGLAFMPKYERKLFHSGAILKMHNTYGQPFALVMRSVRLVCIDIDGKNGGLEHALRLGNLPPTLAETSRSGNGYHLFYSTSESWDENYGFAPFSDRIGVEQGVDIRATGCVFHFQQQRWNDRKIAPLPQYLADLIVKREQQQAASNSRITSILENDDPLETLMMQNELTMELKKPIAPGKRNNTLFAIGAQMFLAKIDDWETQVRDRAAQVGLDHDEIEKLVANISKYGANA